MKKKEKESAGGVLWEDVYHGISEGLSFMHLAMTLTEVGWRYICSTR
jgi:hypothetical protein